MAAETLGSTLRRTVERSPNFPSIPLRKALERARQFYEQEGRNPASAEVAVSHWGYTGMSGSARQTLAALRSFGLFERESGNVRLSDAALRIIRDEREPSPDRDALIARAALEPAIHQKLWAKFEADLPSDANLRFILLSDYNFSSGAVDDFIRDYRDTLAFAGLDRPGSGPLESIPKPEAESFAAGDTRESPTGERDPTNSEAEPAGARLRATPIPSGCRQDVFTLPEGDAVLQWPSVLSPDSFQDLEDWIKLVLRKARRSIRSSNETEP